MGMVFQHFNLFPHKTVLENITLAPIKVKGVKVEDANKKAIELLKLIGLEDKKDAYPASLSGGQKQRIAILRAILQNASIYVFDEATSALDNLTQEKIMEEIDTYLCGKTTIIIAHRLSTVRNADYIYVIENGSVVEEGTHDKLMLKNGAYKKMYMSEI